MINSSQLSKMRAIEINSCNPESLIDLRDISINTSAPLIERVESFFTQVKNPYLFKVDDVIVKVRYGTGKSFSDAISTILSME